MFVTGAFLVGPAMRGWYMILDRLVKGTGKTVVVQKVFLDQTVWATTSLAAILFTVDTLNGIPPNEAKEKLKTNYWPALKSYWSVWPAVQLINFYFIPFQHRVIVVSFISIFWNTYIAWLSNKAVTIRANDR